MAIEFHVIQRKLLSDQSISKYYASVSTRGEVTLEELAEEIGRSSTVSMADIFAVLYSFVENLPHHLADGKIIRLASLGSFRVTISSKGENTEKEVDEHSIRSSKMVFSPGKKFIDMLKTLSFRRRQ